MKKISIEVLDMIKANFGEEKIKRFTAQIKARLKKESEIKRVEIIILKYKKPDLEKLCVNKIIDCTDHPYKITLYDNRPNGANMSKIWNKLIKGATCDHIVIMDSDAFVTEGWLKPLVDAFNNEDCMIAAPYSGNSLITEVQAKMREDAPEFSYNGHVSGFCFMIRRSRLREIGYFDEDYLVFGQDSEFCDRVIAHSKYKIYVVPRSMVLHGIPDSKGLLVGSNSTRLAASEDEFNWDVDTKYAQLRTQKLRLL